MYEEIKIENLSMSKFQALELFKENLNQTIELCGIDEVADINENIWYKLFGIV